MKKVLPLIIFLVFILLYKVRAQTSPFVSLSSRQIAKLEKTKSPARKLKMYRKYYSKDSLKEAKKQEKLVQERWDRGFDQVQAKANRRLDRIKRRPDEKIAKLNDPGDSTANTLSKSVTKIDPSLKLSKIETPSLTNLTRSSQSTGLSFPNLKAIGVPSLNSNLKCVPALPKMPDFKEVNKLKTEYGRYSTELSKYKNQYSQYNRYLTNDSVRKAAVKNEISSLEKEAEKQAMHNAYTSEILKYQKQIDAVKSDQLKYKKQADQLQDSAYRKKIAKEKAEQAAMEYLQKNQQLLKGAQNKMQMLMKKYSVVPNSNDLSTAIKRTSLKGRAFRERLVLATNFQIVNNNPVSIDFSPMAGYQFNTRFVIGAGGTYRQTFASSVIKFAPQMWGYKIFSSYDVVKNFFAYGEFARNAVPAANADKTSSLVWKNAAIVGLGRRISVFRKVDMTVLAGYNFAHQNNDPVYPQPWIFRIGFQTNELTMLKRKPLFNPF